MEKHPQCSCHNNYMHVTRFSTPSNLWQSEHIKEWSDGANGPEDLLPPYRYICPHCGGTVEKQDGDTLMFECRDREYFKCEQCHTYFENSDNGPYYTQVTYLRRRYPGYAKATGNNPS